MRVVNRVTAEGLLHYSSSASLPGGNLVDGLPPVVSSFKNDQNLYFFLDGLNVWILKLKPDHKKIKESAWHSP